MSMRQNNQADVIQTMQQRIAELEAELRAKDESIAQLLQKNKIFREECKRLREELIKFMGI